MKFAVTLIWTTVEVVIKAGLGIHIYYGFIYSSSLMNQKYDSKLFLSMEKNVRFPVKGYRVV